MSKLSKRVHELELLVARLTRDSKIELYEGDKITRTVYGCEGEPYSYETLVNSRHTSVKGVLLDLIRHMGLELEDNPPKPAMFTLKAVEEEPCDE